jgi:hypothetical protein
MLIYVNKTMILQMILANLDHIRQQASGEVAETATERQVRAGQGRMATCV